MMEETMSEEEMDKFFAGDRQAFNKFCRLTKAAMETQEFKDSYKRLWEAIDRSHE